MLEITDRFAGSICDDHCDVMIDVLLALAVQLIADNLGGPHAGNCMRSNGTCIEPGNERYIRFSRRTDIVRFFLALFQFWNGRFIPQAATAQVKCHLVTKQAIVIGDACDPLNQMTAFRAPLVDHLELSAYESA